MNEFSKYLALENFLFLLCNVIYTFAIPITNRNSNSPHTIVEKQEKSIASQIIDQHDESIIVNAEDPSMYPNEQEECVPDEQSFFQSLLKNYNRHKLPGGRRGVEVTVEIHVQDVSTLDEMTSEFDIDVMFSEMWHDPALKFHADKVCKNNISLEYGFFKKRFWYPNTCIVNAKQARIHQSPGDNVFAILYDTGDIWTNYRMRLRGPCELNFVNFPLDRQSCSLVFESYSYNADEVRLQWLNSTPVTPMKNISLPDFDFQYWVVNRSRESYPNGDWSQLLVTFYFKRRFGFYFMQAYVPAYITIMISWISFYIDYRSMPARTTLGVSSLLAVTFQFGNIMKNLPKVSYVKALDVFMMGVTLFIFGSLIELAIVSYIATWYNKDKQFSSSVSSVEKSPNAVCVRKRRRQGGASQVKTVNRYEPIAICGDQGNLSAIDQYTLSTRWKNFAPQSPTKIPKAIRPESVDKISMFLFPLAFLIFNLGYWGYYLIKMND